MNRPQPTRAVAPAKGPAAGAAPPPADKPVTPAQGRRLMQTFAARYEVEPEKLLKTLKDTAFKQPGKNDGGGWKAGPEVTDEQMMALLVVANEYHLNPFTKEIYAFPAKGGGIVPIISIDGWIRIVNERPELEYIEFFYGEDDQPGTLPKDSAYWVECEIKRNDRAKPLRIREYFTECWRNTDPWNTTGRRLLRHRAFIQCGRIVFGYGGIYDPDEGERIANSMAIDTTATDITGRGKPETAEPRARLESPRPVDNGQPQQVSMLPSNDPSPMDQIRALLDSTGCPDNELFGHFEIGDISELTPAMQTQAVEWLKSLQP